MKDERNLSIFNFILFIDQIWKYTSSQRDSRCIPLCIFHYVSYYIV